MGQQLFHRQAALRRVGAGGQCSQVGIRRRPVHGQQRAAQRRQSEAIKPAAGQQFQRAFLGQAVQGLADQLAHRHRPDAFDGGIHRVEAVAEFGIIVAAQHLVAGMDDFQAEVAGLGRAEAAQPVADRELPDLLLAEMEEAQHQAALPFVLHGHLQHRPVAHATFDRDHPHFHLRRHARTQVFDAGQPGPVFIAQRQVKPEILQCGQATRLQLGGHGRTDAREHRQGCFAGR